MMMMTFVPFFYVAKAWLKKKREIKTKGKQKRKNRIEKEICGLQEKHISLKKNPPTYGVTFEI